MSKTFKLDFSNITNITVKMTYDLFEEPTEIDITQPFTITADDNNDTGTVFLLFYGETADFISTPSISTTDNNNITYSGNALRGYGSDEFKYYLRFGEEYDGRAFVAYSDSGLNIYINANVFNGNTKVNCGGVESRGGFFQNDFGLIGIYKIDKQNILNIMSSNRYSLIELGDYGEIQDVLNNIKLVYKTHININDLKPLEAVSINGVTVNGQGQPIENYLVPFETDSVKIQGYYNNAIDNDTEIKLNIPFYGLYSLDSGYINHNLKLKFIYDLMANNALCNIYIDDIVIDVIELKLGYEIPLTDLNINETKQRLYSVYDENCYITLKQKRLAKNIVSTVIENTTINNEIINNNLNGFIKCNDVKIISDKITDNEKEMLINLLQSGIYI